MGVVVILREAVPIVLERIERRGGDDAGLAHRAAQHLFLAPGFLDEVLRAGQRGADRRAQALGVVEPQRVGAGGVILRAGAGFDSGVAQAGAVHVDGEAGIVRDLGHAPQRFDRPDRAEAAVRRVLDRHQPRARGVAAVGVAKRRLHLVGGEHAIWAVQHADHHARIGRGAAGLGVDDMGGLVGDDLVAQPAMDPDGGLVAHGAARHENRVFLAQDLANAVAQAVDGGILVLLLVAHLCLGHGLAHAGGGLGFGVAVEVDKAVLHGGFRSPAPP